MTNRFDDNLLHEIARKWMCASDCVSLKQRLHEAGLAIVPIEPTPGVLASMAMRDDHSFGIPRQSLPAIPGARLIQYGFSQEMRDSRLSDMRKVYQEVVGTGFYTSEREERYARVGREEGNL